MRKYLSLTELVEEYQGLFTPDLSKDQRRYMEGQNVRKMS